MRKMNEILPLVCSYLNESNAEYVIVGGIVVSIHGVPRSTTDLDVIVSLQEKSLANLVEFLKKNGFHASIEDARAAFAERSHFTAEDTLSHLRLDIKGVYNEMDRNALARRMKFNFKGVNLMIETPEDLIAAKLHFGSDQDIRDAEGVFRMQKARLDLSYLEAACKSYGVSEALKALKTNIVKAPG